MGPLEGILASLEDELKDSLVSTFIWSNKEKKIVAGKNFHKKGGILISELTYKIEKLLHDGNFPKIGDYYLFDLKNDKKLVVIPNDHYQWSILFDSVKIPLGLFLNVILPEMIKKFNNIFKEDNRK